MRCNRLLFGLSALLVTLIANLAAPPYAEAASKYKILHAFGKGRDGAGVFAGLARDAKGNLYGVTNGGVALTATARSLN